MGIELLKYLREDMVKKYSMHRIYKENIAIEVTGGYYEFLSCIAKIVAAGVYIEREIHYRPYDIYKVHVDNHEEACITLKRYIGKEYKYRVWIKSKARCIEEGCSIVLYKDIEVVV